MSTALINFVLHIPTDLKYHLKQKFQKYLFSLAFTVCRKVNI